MKKSESSVRLINRAFRDVKKKSDENCIRFFMNLWVSKCYNQYNNRYFFLLVKIFLLKSYSLIVDNAVRL